MGVTRGKAIRCIGILAISLALAAAAAAQDASVTVSPRFAGEGETVRVTVRVEPSPSLRALVIEADSPELFRSSTIVLEGARSARVHTVELRSLPAGKYEVRVAIHEDAGVDAILRTTFRIVS